MTTYDVHVSLSNQAVTTQRAHNVELTSMQRPGYWQRDYKCYATWPIIMIGTNISGSIDT